MYMYGFSWKMVPVPMQPLGEFIAPNPWTGNQREKWNLNTYALTSETFATTMRWNALAKERKQKEDVPTRRAKLHAGKLKMGHTVGFESADGRAHMLPRMLVELWKSQQVADSALPGLLHQFEPELKKSDFKMYRPRMIFKVEAILMLVFAFMALAVFVADKTLDTGHRQTQLKQAAWLEQPMHEQTVWAQGQGADSLGCFRLRTGVVKVPAGLNTYGTPGLICGFKAGSETRLALVDVQESAMRAASPKTAILLRGVVLPPAKLGLPPEMLEALGKRFPQLNKDFVFVYNADWGNPDGFSLGEAGPIVGWVGLGLTLPFWLYLFFARRWRARDAAMKAKFQSGVGYAGAGVTGWAAGVHA